MQAVIATYDPSLLAELVGACVASLRRYRDLARHVSPDHMHALYAAIVDLIANGDMALLIPAVRACATALWRYPNPAAVPADVAQELYRALNDFGPAAVALYPAESRDARAR